MPKKSVNKKYLKALLFLLLLVISFGIWYISFSFHYFQGYHDGLDYAQIAENVYSKRGMTTRIFPLFGLVFLKEKNMIDKEWPNLHRFPFPVFMIAFMYLIFGINDFAAAFSSGIFYILSIPLFYALSEKVLKSTITSTLVTFILLLNPYILSYSRSSTTEMASIFFFMLLIYVLYGSSSIKSYIFAGLIIGVFYYNRYNVILFLPALILFVLIHTKEKRIRNIFSLVISFMIAVLPWSVYCLSYSNSPLFSLNAKANFPVLTNKYPYQHSLWFGLDYVNELEFLLSYPGQMLRKWVNQFLHTIRFFPQLLGGNLYLFAFFFIGLFEKEQDLKRRNLKKLIFLFFVFQVLIIPFYLNSARYYIGFTPIFMLLAFDYFLKVLTRLHLKKWVKQFFIGIMIVFLFYSFGIKRLVAGFPYTGVDYSIRSEMHRNLSSLNSFVYPKDVICSDIVVATGRYIACRSLPLPEDYETIKKIQKDFLPIKYILLSNYILTKEIWKKWWPIFKNQKEINNFVLIKRFSDGTLLYINRDFEKKLDMK